MFKKVLILLFMLIINPVFADTMPFYVDSIPKRMLGVYQTDKDITLMSHPESNSQIIKKIEFSYNPETMPDNMFAILLNEKQLGFLYVSDIADEGWVEVVYDKQTGAKGWVQTQDRMQFLPWLNFYNLYGRKYGLRFMKDTPEDIENLYAKLKEDLYKFLKKDIETILGSVKK